MPRVVERPHPHLGGPEGRDPHPRREIRLVERGSARCREDERVGLDLGGSDAFEKLYDLLVKRDVALTLPGPRPTVAPEYTTRENAQTAAGEVDRSPAEADRLARSRAAPEPEEHARRVVRRLVLAEVVGTSSGAGGPCPAQLGVGVGPDLVVVNSNHNAQRLGPRTSGRSSAGASLGRASAALRRARRCRVKIGLPRRSSTSIPSDAATRQPRGPSHENLPPLPS